jgi:hypothetical protein
MAVLNVSDDVILLRVGDGISYYDLPVSVGEAFDLYTTLGAWFASQSGRIVILSYSAELLVLDESIGRVAALYENATYTDGISRVISQRWVELPDFLLLRSEVTVIANFGGSPFESLDTRSLLRVDGIEPLTGGNAMTRSIPLEGRQVSFVLFNGDALFARLEGSTLIVDTESQETALLATIMTRDLLVSIRGFESGLSKLLWPLNGTDVLFGVRLEPGSSHLVFELTAALVATTPVAAGRLRQPRREGRT